MAFDAAHPIVGTVNINATQNIPSYGVQLTLYCKDRSIKIDRGKNGEPHVHSRTVIVFEKHLKIHSFDGNICPMGQSSYPFQFDIPENMIQSSVYQRGWGEFYCRYVYFFRAQIIPVDVDMVTNHNGKCKLREKHRVLICPVRPVVVNPQFNINHVMNKQVGLISSKASDLFINA